MARITQIFGCLYEFAAVISIGYVFTQLYVQYLRHFVLALVA